MIHDRLCELLEIDIPIIQAPIGDCGSADLVAAVSNAGALGMISASWRSPAELRRAIRDIRSCTDRPFGVNFVLQWPEAQHDLLMVALEEEVRVLSFFWGDPGPYVERLDGGDVRVLHTVGSASEARASVEKGVDIVVAQGVEAGGHVWAEVSTMALVPSVADAVGETPVVAAGGIGDGRGIAAAFALGAAGVWMGTRFVAAAESLAHPDYKRALVDAAEADTVYTRLFDSGWPDAPHRVLRNSTTRLGETAAQRGDGDVRPDAETVLGHMSDGSPIKRYSDMEPRRGTTGQIEAMCMYAGQSCGVIHDIPSAGDLVALLWDDAVKILHGFSSLSERPVR